MHALEGKKCALIKNETKKPFAVNQYERSGLSVKSYSAFKRSGLLVKRLLCAVSVSDTFPVHFSFPSCYCSGPHSFQPTGTLWRKRRSKQKVPLNALNLWLQLREWNLWSRAGYSELNGRQIWKVVGVQCPEGTCLLFHIGRGSAIVLFRSTFGTCCCCRVPARAGTKLSSSRSFRKTRLLEWQLCQKVIAIFQRLNPRDQNIFPRWYAAAIVHKEGDII